MAITITENWRDRYAGGGLDIDIIAITALEEEKKLETTGIDIRGKDIFISTELGKSTMSVPVAGPSVMEKTTSKIETRD